MKMEVEVVEGMTLSTKAVRRDVNGMREVDAKQRKQKHYEKEASL